MNITKTTEEYIRLRPSIMDCLKKDTINFSRLSREIIKEYKLKETDFDAVLIACRRLRDKLKKKQSFEKPIIEILKKTKIEVKNKVCVITLNREINFNILTDIGKEIKKNNEVFLLIEGTNVITMITSEEFIPLIKKQLNTKIIKINKDLIKIILKSSEDIENTPGVVSYLYSLFGEFGINIIETMSCWTDTIFVLEEKDLTKTMEILKF